MHALVLASSLAGQHLGRLGRPKIHDWAAVFRAGDGLGNAAWRLVKAAVRFLCLHTGLPALLVAAVLVVLGYRLLQRTARFVVEVVAITAAPRRDRARVASLVATNGATRSLD